MNWLLEYLLALGASWGQFAPKWRQDPQHGLQNPQLGAKVVPKTPQLGSQMAPKILNLELKMVPEPYS